MADANRVYDGFASLTGGMNGGIASNLIDVSQCAFMKDFTVRDGYIKTRSPWKNRVYSFDSDTTESRFTGKFQGAKFYNSIFGNNGFVISKGGKLFFHQLDGDIITEITPKLVISTTAPFTRPSIASTVLVSISSESPLSVGETVHIDSGVYTVTSLFTNQALLTRVSGGANATVATGSVLTDVSGNIIIEYQVNPDFYDMVYMFPAENYIIALAGQQSPIIFDGASTRRAGVGEIPAGAFGVYFLGRIWITLPNRSSFIAGDIVYGPSGTSGNGFVDAILKVTENTFLNEGGAFTVPYNSGPITAMFPLAQLDTSLGVGPLLIGTTNSVFSVNAPADRTTWKNLTYPIQSFSLLDYGPQGPRNTQSVNGDMWYRSIDGVRSFIVARRDINMWGNTPMSREVSPIIENDSDELLIYGSAMLLNNRLYQTISPMRTADGIVHKGLISINYDLISSMSNKLPPAWEGLTTGLDIFQLEKGIDNGREAGFAFANNAGTLEIWEFQDTGYYDQYTVVSGSSTSITRVAIQPYMETRSGDFGNSTQLKKLHTCEIYLDEIVDDVSLTIKYRPDQYPVWTTWATVNLCTTKTQCQTGSPQGTTCKIWQPNATGYAARLLLPSPDDNICNTFNDKPMIFGYEFQFRIEGTGHFRIKKFKPHASLQSDKVEGGCPDIDPTCHAIADCQGSYFTYDSHG